MLILWKVWNMISSISNDTSSVQNSEPLNLKFVFLLLD